MNRVLVLGLAALVLASCAGFGLGRSPALEQHFQNARSGDADGQYELAMRYTNGYGLDQNYASGVGWFRRAAELGHAGAQYMMGIAYSTGRGIDPDAATAAKWFETSAGQGNAHAQYQIGEA